MINLHLELLQQHGVLNADHQAIPYHGIFLVEFAVFCKAVQASEVLLCGLVLTLQFLVELCTFVNDILPNLEEFIELEKDILVFLPALSCDVRGGDVPSLGCDVHTSSASSPRQ